MDSFLIFWILIILLTIRLTIGLIYLGYWIPKRFGKRKLGKWVVGILSIAVLSLILSVVFEDELFLPPGPICCTAKELAVKTIVQHPCKSKQIV